MNQLTASFLAASKRPPTLRQPGAVASPVKNATYLSGNGPVARSEPITAVPVLPPAAGGISGFIECLLPTTTAQQKGARATKDGGVRFFKKAKTRVAEAMLADILRPLAPDKPMTGPLAVTLSMVFPWRKGEKKDVTARFSLYPVETRPDLSNLHKGIEDVMTSLGFWHDDSQVADLHIFKYRGDRPGIGVQVSAATALDKAGGSALI